MTLNDWGDVGMVCLFSLVVLTVAWGFWEAWMRGRGL